MVVTLRSSKFSPSRAGLLSARRAMRPDLTLAQFAGERLRPVEEVIGSADTPDESELHNPAA